MSQSGQLKALLGKHYMSTQKTLILSSGSPYNSYEQEMESNLRTILKKFSYLDKTKVRNLLQELENNLEAAIKILEDEEKDCMKISEEKKIQLKPLHLSQEEENQIFKRSFLKLYKKNQLTLKQNEDLKDKIRDVNAENERLKCMVKMLLENEYRQNNFISNNDIC